MANFCKYCGHKLKESSKFCPGCGKQLVSSAPTSGTVPLSDKEPVSAKEATVSGAPVSHKGESVSVSAVSQNGPSANRMAPPPLREKPPVREDMSDPAVSSQKILQQASGPAKNENIKPTQNINVRKQTAKKKDPTVVAEVLLGIACLFLFIAIILTAPGRIKAAINGNLMSEGGQGMLLTGSDGNDEDGASGHKKNDDKKSGTKTGDEETDSDKNGSEEDMNNGSDAKGGSMDETPVTEEMIENNSENYKPSDTHGNYRWLYESQDMSEDHTE